MNPIEILLNYLDISKFLVMIVIILLILVTYFILSLDLSTFSEDFNIKKMAFRFLPLGKGRKKKMSIIL